MKYIARIDERGRMDIPSQIMEILNLSPGGSVALEVKDNDVIMCYHENLCCFCGGRYEVEKRGDNYICSACFSELKKGTLCI